LFFRYSTLALAYFAKRDYQKAKEWAQRTIARRSNWWLAYAVLTASHTRLGDMNSAKAALSRLLNVLPGRSITTLPFLSMHDDQLERLLEGLRLAGLPDR
jgi:adenylate cyclase